MQPSRSMLPLLLVARVALAQDFAPEAPPPPPAPPQPELVQPLLPPPAPQQPSYFDRCFAVPGQVWVSLPSGAYYRVSGPPGLPLSAVQPAAPVTTLPADAPTAEHGAHPVNGSSSSSSGGGDVGKGLLVLAVVAVAVLPVIVYAVDSEAPAVVEQRFFCPTVGFDLLGGVDTGPAGWGGAGLGRLRFGVGYFGLDFDFQLSATALNAWSTHAELRIKPKQHIEPAIAAGFRTMRLGDRIRLGFEVGVPHRYVFYRDNLRQLSLELRPTLMVGSQGVDVGLEGALVIPLFEPLHLRVGGHVNSFGDAILGGASAGVSFVF